MIFELSKLSSAVNNKGTYNTGNMTEFTEMEVEEGQEDVPEPKESEGLKIDASDGECFSCLSDYDLTMTCVRRCPSGCYFLQHLLVAAEVLC